MVKEKKKPILLLPISSEELEQRVIKYMKDDPACKQFLDMFELAKEDRSTLTSRFAKLRHSKAVLIKSGFDIGIVLSYYQMGGHDSSKGGSNVT